MKTATILISLSFLATQEASAHFPNHCTCTCETEEDLQALNQELSESDQPLTIEEGNPDPPEFFFDEEGIESLDEYHKLLKVIDQEKASIKEEKNDAAPSDSLSADAGITASDSETYNSEEVGFACSITSGRMMALTVLIIDVGAILFLTCVLRKRRKLSRS